MPIAALVMMFLAGAQDQPPMSVSECTAVEKAVLESNARMTEAAEARDVDRLFSFMMETDKGSVIQGGKILLSRSQALEQVRENMRGIARLGYRWKQQHVTVLSPSAAVVVSEGEASATTEQGQAFTRPFVQTAVFVLKDGHWKVLHAHQSSPLR